MMYLQSFVGIEMLLQSVMVKVALVADGAVVGEMVHVSSYVLLVAGFGSETCMEICIEI